MAKEESIKIKPFRLEGENSVIMLEVYGSLSLHKEAIFKLENITSIALDDCCSESFRVGFIDGTTLYLMYDESDNECLSYDELKKLWFNDIAIKRKEKILNDQMLTSIFHKMPTRKELKDIAKIMIMKECDEVDSDAQCSDPKLLIPAVSPFNDKKPE